MSKQRVTIS